MPIYEFKCTSCGHEFEDLVPMNTEGDKLACTQCGHVGASRLVSKFAAHGLENGHIAVGRKLTGGTSTPPAEGGSVTTEGTKPAAEGSKTTAEGSKPAAEGSKTTSGGSASSTATSHVSSAVSTGASASKTS
jgi:putative FmdB family regulatory protein